MNDVIIVGAGPVGMMLAGELRLAGVDVVVLEKLEAPTGLSKALAVTGRGEDYLAMRGLLERFRRRAPPAPPGLVHFALIPLPIQRTRVAPKGVFVPQAIVEEILDGWAVGLGATIRRGVTVTALQQDDEGVTLTTERSVPQTNPGPDSGRSASLEAGEDAWTGQVRARYVVGCDGGRSVVRRAAGIAFPGVEPTSLLRLGDVKLEEGSRAPPMLIPLGDGWLRLITKEPMPDAFDLSTPMTLEELRASAQRAFGVALPLREARWLSRFTDASRQAESYRRGRVFVAGDAAHIQLPAGGPGLLTGLGDAVNLGWKLGAVVRGSAQETILDSYHAERHPVGARVLLDTRAQGRLMSVDAGSASLRAVMAELVEIPDVAEHLLRMLWQLDTRYGNAGASSHPIAGTFAPDAMLTTPEGPTSILALLHAGRWLAIEKRPTFDASVERLGAKRVVASRIDGAGDIGALLVRPDGHVAWAASGDDHDAASLRATIDAWT